MEREVTYAERLTLRTYIDRHRSSIDRHRQLRSWYRRMYPLYLKPIGDLALAGMDRLVPNK